MSMMVHASRLIVGLIFLFLSFVLFWVLSFFLWPFVTAAQQYPLWAVPITILLFLVYAYFIGLLATFVVRRFAFA